MPWVHRIHVTYMWRTSILYYARRARGTANESCLQHIYSHTPILLFILTHQYSYSLSHTRHLRTRPYDPTQILLFISTHKYSYLLSHTNTPLHYHTQIHLLIFAHHYFISLHVRMIPYKYRIHVFILTDAYSFPWSHTNTPSPYMYSWSHTTTPYMHSVSHTLHKLHIRLFIITHKYSISLPSHHLTQRIHLLVKSLYRDPTFLCAKHTLGSPAMECHTSD